MLTYHVKNVNYQRAENGKEMLQSAEGGIEKSINHVERQPELNNETKTGT